jgi:hypothetical protein
MIINNIIKFDNVDNILDSYSTQSDKGFILLSLICIII